MSDHYKQLPSGIFEPIEIWMRNGLNACAGNMLKYMVRFPYKGTPYHDWLKVRDYYEIWRYRILNCKNSYKVHLPAKLKWCSDSLDYYSDVITKLIPSLPCHSSPNIILRPICRNIIPAGSDFDGIFNAVMESDYMRPYLPIVPQPKQFESNDGC